MALKKFLDLDGLEHFLSKLDEKYNPIGALTYKGTVSAVSDLPGLAASTVKVGWMYMFDTETQTTADFVEGAGKPIQKNDEVACVNMGTDTSPVFKWSIVGPVFDVSNRLQFGTTMPTSPKEGDYFLYMGETSYKYTAVTPVGTENPKEEGWYEYNGTNYTPTTDTAVQTGTSYFKREEEYVKGVIYKYASSNWISQSSGDTFAAITDSEIDSLFD